MNKKIKKSWIIITVLLVFVIGFAIARNTDLFDIETGKITEENANKIVLDGIDLKVEFANIMEEANLTQFYKDFSDAVKTANPKVKVWDFNFKQEKDVIDATIKHDDNETKVQIEILNYVDNETNNENQNNVDSENNTENNTQNSNTKPEFRVKNPTYYNVNKNRLFVPLKNSLSVPDGYMEYVNDVNPLEAFDKEDGVLPVKYEFLLETGEILAHATDSDNNRIEKKLVLWHVEDPVITTKPVVTTTTTTTTTQKPVTATTTSYVPRLPDTVKPGSVLVEASPSWSNVNLKDFHYDEVSYYQETLPEKPLFNNPTPNSLSWIWADKYYSAQYGTVLFNSPVDFKYNLDKVYKKGSDFNSNCNIGTYEDGILKFRCTWTDREEFFSYDDYTIDYNQGTEIRIKYMGNFGELNRIIEYQYDAHTRMQTSRIMDIGDNTTNAAMRIDNYELGVMWNFMHNSTKAAWDGNLNQQLPSFLDEYTFKNKNWIIYE